MSNVQGKISGSVVATILVIGFALVICTPEIVKASPTGLTGQSGENVEQMTEDLKPTILYREYAKYSDEALKNGLEGTVILEVVFAADGNMKDLKVYSGLPDGLTESAIAAAQKFRFEPATREGKPVSVRGKLELEFKLPKSAGPAPAKKRESETVYAMSATLRPTITYRENAGYTQEASERNIYGTVILTVVFRADRKLGAIKVKSGLPYGLTESAITAARALRFDPALKDGKPVSVRGNLEFSFSM